MTRWTIDTCSDKQKALLAKAAIKMTNGNTMRFIDYGNKETFTGGNAAISFTDVEPPTRNEPLAESKGAFFDSPVSIHIHSIRKRLTDSDGVSAKAAIDGLVHAKILLNDDPSKVHQVTYSQAKGEPEQTIITITEV